MQILSLADDMTGALEVASTFAGFGFRSAVSTKPMTADRADVVVIDTETRHRAPAVAAGRVISLTREYGIVPDLLYKKTDSTLRGNIQSELEAIHTLFPHLRIAYVPAYPSQGRTLKHGLLYVNGRQLHETSAANDALNPVRSSSVSELIGPHLPCVIFDGETD
ncbi:MAG TPA: four-carbon acid sugar kinase family protein, partial [Bryobacteraceae bacterium]|nr:four-carbon acid sugar kinase family protein [Bryobacteraceae bacterium]